MSASLVFLILSNGPADVVDAVRLSLEANSSFWFRLVKYSGYAVAFGCVMEAPETFVTIKRWWLLKFRNKEHKETKNDKVSWFIPLAAVGLIIIVLGIFAETYFEGKVSDADSDLRAYESDKITSAEEQAASAIRGAGSAANSAKVARDASAAAVTQSGAANINAASATIVASSASETAKTVELKAAELDEKLNAANAQLADLEGKRTKLEKSLINVAICSAPRVIPRWAFNIVGPLHSLKGISVSLVVEDDPEARRAASSLEQTLAVAGAGSIKRTPRLPNEYIPDGVSIESYGPANFPDTWPPPSSGMNERKAATDLMEFLHSYNWQAEVHGGFSAHTDLIPYGIRIAVGLYPTNELVTPPALQGIEAAYDRQDQQYEDYRRAESEKYLNERIKKYPPAEADKARKDWETRQAEIRGQMSQYRKDQPCRRYSAIDPQDISTNP